MENTNYNNSLVKKGVIRSLFFCLRSSRTNRTLIRAISEDHFADNFSAAEIILLAKMGKQKLLGAIFSVRLFAPIFSSPLCGPKTQ